MREIVACRACNALELEHVLDLGELHVNAFPLPGEPDTEKAPLTLVVCTECSLVQLTHTVDADKLYRQFWYRSGITLTMKKALLDVVMATLKRADVAPGDTVVDIGSNDSTLLRYWPGSLERVGFEPATNLMEEARQGGITVVNDYYSLKGLREVTGKKARVVTAVAMFYDLDQPQEFVHEVAEALAKDGVFVVQMAYLPKMLCTNDIGNVCHEHLEYYSLSSLEPLLASCGLYVFDVEENTVNGGSFRVFASKEKRPPSEKLSRLRWYEHNSNLTAPSTLQFFAQRVARIRMEVRKLLWEAPRPYVYGASTKGNTLLQYWEVGREVLKGAAERDQQKWGRETVGTRIPIIPEEMARADASHFLVLPWHFKEEILAREEEWLAGGGHFIFPLPEVEVR